MSKELPYFKFFPTEWLLGRINNENATTQISFLKSCCLYWQKDCKLTVGELLIYVPLAKIKYLIDEDYLQCRYKHEFTNPVKKNKIRIKFLDEQKTELSEKRNKKVEAGRLGGKMSAKNRKKKTKKEYIDELTTHPDPNLRIHKETAKLLVEDKIKRGEILI